MKSYIGIDLGGTNVRTALVDENGVKLDFTQCPTIAEEGVKAVMTRIFEQIKSLDYNLCGGFENVVGIGIGVPGPVDTQRGCMKMAQNLPEFEGFPVCDVLYKAFGIPVYMENDANVAALAEALVGAGKDYRSVYYVTCSTGIGGGFIYKGMIIRGYHGYAGEIGNIIIKPNGYKSGIRNAGSAESEASGNALLRLGNDFLSGDKILNAAEVFRRAADGDEIAKKLVADFVNGYSTVIADIAHTVDPACFVLGGGVADSSEYFWDDLVEQVNAKLFPGLRGEIPILKYEVPHGGCIGAALLVKMNAE